MEKTRVIQFEMTYEEYLAIVVAATFEINATSAYLETRGGRNEHYSSGKARVEALKKVLQKMNERVDDVIKDDADKKYAFMKG